MAKYTVPSFILFIIKINWHTFSTSKQPKTKQILLQAMQNTVTKLDITFPSEVTIIFVSPKFIQKNLHSETMLCNPDWILQFIS